MQPFPEGGSLIGVNIVFMRKLITAALFVCASIVVMGQGFGIPSKRGGIGFGNLERFTGIRFNFKDRDVERLVGVNVTVWSANNDENQTGTMTGLAIGLPLTMGVENQRGISVGVFGAGAKQNLSGINIGGLGVGAGGNVSGFNFGGLGVGAGGSLTGVSIGVLGAGAGDDVRGISVGGLGVGSGGSLAGLSFGGLGVGAGSNLNGISLGGLGVGAGEDITGLTGALVGVGAGGRVRGITVAGVAIGSGEAVTGISAATVAIGSPRVNGIAVAGVVGGLNIKGLIIAPAYLRVGAGKPNKDNDDDTTPDEVIFTGFGISIFNRVMGEQRGVTIGAVNSTHEIKGVQFGLINVVKSNPRGLRVLPVFNTRFGKGK